MTGPTLLKQYTTMCRLSGICRGGVLEKRGNGPEMLFMPGFAAVIRKFQPIVAVVAHFLNRLIGGPLLIFQPQIGDDDAGAVVAAGAVDVDAAGFGRVENI